MKRFEAKLTLFPLLKRAPVLYLEHSRAEEQSYGRYYAITDKQLVHITHYIAKCLYEYSDSLIKIPNKKSHELTLCLKTLHPETTIHNLSEYLYGRWDTIKFYQLEGERVF